MMKKLIKYMAIAAIITACAGFTTMAVQAATVSGSNPGTSTTKSTTQNNNEKAQSQTSITYTAPVKPTVDTVMNAKSVPGVASVTEKASIDAAAGLKDGETSKFYIGDVYKPEVKKALKEAAASLNGTVISMLDIDLYALGKETKIRGANELTEAIDVVITLPKRVAGTDVTFVFVNADGTVVEYADVDSDPNTFTLRTKTLGAFAIIVK